MFTLFIPGLEPGPADRGPRQPALERLLARGRARPLEVSPWALLARLAGGDLDRWPVGPVSALGELAAPPHACLRVEPLGGENERHGVFRLPAASLGIERCEAAALAEAFFDTLGAGRLRLEIATPERWYLALGGDRDVAQDAGPVWSGFAGPAQSLADDERPAPPEADLRLLLSEIEMLFHAHPVNVARRERAAPGIAGLHPWGGGRLPATATAGSSPRVSPRVSPHAAPDGSPLVEEPYLAGLRRLGAVRGASAASFRVDPADTDGIAWPAAVETLDARQLADIEANWAAPLLGALLRGRLAGVRIVTGDAVYETRRLDALRFWRRPRPMAALC